MDLYHGWNRSFEGLENHNHSGHDCAFTSEVFQWDELRRNPGGIDCHQLAAVPNAPFISGTTQYGDADLRAEFWDRIPKNSPNYHVLVGTPTIANTLALNIPSVDGATATDPSTGKTIGLVVTGWLDGQLQSLLTSMHFTPTMLPIFLSYDVFATSGAPKLSDCCFGGYHNAVNNQTGLQTYIWSTATDQGIQGGFSEDVGSLSHEMLE